MTPFPARPLPGLTRVLHIHTLPDRCRMRKRSGSAATPILFNSSVHFRGRSLQHHFASSATKPRKTQGNRNGNNLFVSVVPSPRPKRLRNRFGHPNSVAGACSIRWSLCVKAWSPTRTAAGASRHRFARFHYRTHQEPFDCTTHRRQRR